MKPYQVTTPTGDVTIVSADSAQTAANHVWWESRNDFSAKLATEADVNWFKYNGGSVDAVTSDADNEDSVEVIDTFNSGELLDLTKRMAIVQGSFTLSLRERRVVTSALAGLGVMLDELIPLP